ncbi:hypothetical protein [Palleronia rufa]|uniref:hypothetical protein n=1 Tax=Palleronia rufa TaxID=1530186 RepID=UPI000B0F971A|nr:hypothetical protein [Palleronia rufa]
MDFTFFYIVEPPEYQMLGVRLAASLREAYGPDIRLVGYCPAHRMEELHPAVFKAHALLGAEIRPMVTEGMWDTPYPHGNKIIACLQERSTRASAFVDSDVLFLHPIPLGELVTEGAVSASMAASMGWNGDERTWRAIYGELGLTLPEERMEMMRQKKQGAVVPYFSSGFVAFSEAPGPHGRFPRVWYDTARTLDRMATLERRRPYLDQMSLAPAIRAAGLDWNVLPEERHFILGGRLRGKPIPDDRTIYCVHYRRQKVLAEVGLKETSNAQLRKYVGTKFVTRLTEKPDRVAPIQPIPVPGQA